VPLPPTDEALRAALDPYGALRPGALDAPSPREALTVYAQRHDARLDLLQLQQQARRFFGARVGLTVEKAYPPDRPPPSVDAAHVVVAPKNISAETRFIYGRPRTQEDLEAAEAAEARSGGGGLALLARRCGYVWLVGIEAEPDPHALLLAAILGSVLLGPILAPSGEELFGVKTARLKLECLGIES
jgi:hypothetical protein